MVEKIAAELGAKHRPSYQTWRRAKGPKPAGVDMIDHGEFFWTEPGGPDDSTMVSFIDPADGGTSLRALTWREVVDDVLSLAVPHIEAAIRSKIAAEIEDVRCLPAFPPDRFDEGFVHARDMFARVARGGSR
jgi:hypothetical protein